MKVLVFTNLYPNNVWPNHGVFIKERMTHFAKLDGCTIKVVAPVPYFPRLRVSWRWKFSQVVPMEVRDGIEVYHPKYLMIPKIGMSLYGLMMFLSVLRTVRRIKRNFDFDLIDAHFVYPDGFAAVLLGWIFGKPVVISARGSDINLYAKFPLIRKILRYTLCKADKVIAVCQALKDAMVELGTANEKIFVIPNGVDHRKFFQLPPEDARRKVGLPAGKKVILSVGGLVPRKGFDLLIKTLGLLEQILEDDLYLVIIGDGPSRSDLERLIGSLGLRGRVLLAGNIPHEELYAWYSAADLFCLASDREGWPNVLLESLACGTPVIATNIWGVPEVIQSDKVGFLTERSEKALATAILRGVQTTWFAEEIVAYAQRHTWESAAVSVRDVFDDVLKKYSRVIVNQAGLFGCRN
jgi:glycosyltransferase involved in cell wall biosynthesis